MKAHAVQSDLPELWSELGVEPLEGQTFNERAPLAAVRRAITAAPVGAKPCRSLIRKSVKERGLPFVVR
jgi:hypothetical protein